MFPGGADRMPKEMNMICMRHLDVVKVEAQDGTACHSPEFKLPGIEIFTQGTGKTGMKIVDMAAFEAYIEANPELKQIIEHNIEQLEAAK